MGQETVMMGRAGSGTRVIIWCQIRPRQKELSLHPAQSGWQRTQGGSQERRGEHCSGQSDKLHKIGGFLIRVRKGAHTLDYIWMLPEFSLKMEYLKSLKTAIIVVDKLHKIVCFHSAHTGHWVRHNIADNHTNEASRLKLDNVSLCTHLHNNILTRTMFKLILRPVTRFPPIFWGNLHSVYNGVK